MTRPLPHNAEAEETVIGAVLLDPSTLGQLDLAADDFYDSNHQEIWDTIQTLAGEGKPVEAESVIAEMQRSGTLAKVGGAGTLTGLLARAPGSSTVAYWAGLLAEQTRRRQIITNAARIVEAGYGGEPLEELEARRIAPTTRRNPDLLVDGYTFFTSQTAEPAARWGRPGEVLWAQQEPLMIAAPTGVGKTTLSQHLALSKIGIGGTVLDFPVTPIDGKLLYIAADRPAQAARSGARLVGSMDEDVLRERLRVHRGPLPFNLASAEPWQLADWIERADCSAVIVDSLGNVATDLSKDEVGSRVNQAISHVVARGIDIVVNHHDRKRGRGEDRKRPTIDDIYGSQWLTAGMGSVVYLHGRPGDPIATLLHFKGPAGEVPPFDILIDHHSGAVTRDQGRDPFEILKHSSGLTVKQGADLIYGDDGRNSVEKTRRQLERLVDRGLAKPVKGDGPKSPVTYYAVTTEAEPDEAAELLPA